MVLKIVTNRVAVHVLSKIQVCWFSWKSTSLPGVYTLQSSACTKGYALEYSRYGVSTALSLAECQTCWHYCTCTDPWTLLAVLLGNLSPGV